MPFTDPKKAALNRAAQDAILEDKLQEDVFEFYADLRRRATARTRNPSLQRAIATAQKKTGRAVALHFGDGACGVILCNRQASHFPDELQDSFVFI